ncbi:MAG: FKBP-type peptidyl-prolyl cis-trans isomerase [Vicinamibacterales bacterium]
MTSFARLRSLLLPALLVVAAACNNGSSSPTAPDQSAIPYSQVDLTVGTGAEAAVGKAATVQYAGWLYSDTGPDHKGTQFDAGSLAPFVIGSNTLIKGFEMAVTGMKVGGIRRAVIPPSLAYGATGSSSIPPNAALVFEILLGNVQ